MHRIAGTGVERDATPEMKTITASCQSGPRSYVRSTAWTRIPEERQTQ